jgi:hypothetical protein
MRFFQSWKKIRLSSNKPIEGGIFLGGSFSEDFFGRIFGKIVFGEILWYEFFVLF